MKQKIHFLKRISVCVMVVIMTLTAVPLSGFVGLELPKAAEITVVADAADEEGYSIKEGKGTASDPYCIYSIEDFNAMQNNMNAHYLLCSDLSFTGTEWKPAMSYFYGTFDGQGHTIKNISSSKVGLFYYNRGTIKNLVVENFNLSGKTGGGSYGCLASENAGTISNCVVKNSKISLVLAEYYDLNYLYVGGIAGNGNGRIENSVSDVKIDVESPGFACIAGVCGGSNTVSNCVVFGDINVESYANAQSSAVISVSNNIPMPLERIDLLCNGVSGLGNADNCLFAGESITVNAAQPYFNHWGGNYWGSVDWDVNFVSLNKNNSFYIKNAKKYIKISGVNYDEIEYPYPYEFNAEKIGVERAVDKWGDLIDIELFDGIKKSIKITLPDSIILLNKKETYKIVPVIENASDDYEITYNTFSEIVTVSDSGVITAVEDGCTDICIWLYDNQNQIYGYTMCTVFIGQTSQLEISNKYDANQYYAGGGFISQLSQISDCVEIYYVIENKLASKLNNYNNITTQYPEKFKTTKPITLKAKVSGSDLSFDANKYVNTLTKTYSGIEPKTAIDDLLMLFPINLSALPAQGRKYTVSVSFSCESFDTFTETVNFTVIPIESVSAMKHINDCIKNTDVNGVKYRVSKENVIGSFAKDYQGDNEYKWFKFINIDYFENYFELVLADIMAGILNSTEYEMPTLIPSAIKEFKDNYKTVLSGIKNIIENDSEKFLDCSETKIDKLLKKSKYTTDKVIKDPEFQLFNKILGKDKSNTALRKVFSAADKTGQYLNYVKGGISCAKDCVEFYNRMSVLNSFENASDSFKDVIRCLYNKIPADNSEHKKMREAVKDYLDYTGGISSQFSVVFENVAELTFDMGLDIFKTYVGKSLANYIGAKVFTWIGTKTIKGVLISSTTLFNAASSAIIPVSTGIKFGTLLSDLITDGNSLEEEMSKSIAMGKYSSYIIETLQYYEDNLIAKKTDASVSLFECAFELHQTCQSYMFDKTINAMNSKNNSFVMKVLKWYDKTNREETIAEWVKMKNDNDNIRCHFSDDLQGNVTEEKKVLIIKCPVNVFVYGISGNEVVKIINDKVVYADKSSTAAVSCSEKYIALSSDNQYKVRIIPYSEGDMTYSFEEFSEKGLVRKVDVGKIKLGLNEVFEGNIPKDNGADKALFALKKDVIESHTCSCKTHGDGYCDICGKEMLKDEGTLESGLKWKFDYFGVLKIEGSGKMDNFELLPPMPIVYSTAPWSKYVSEILEVVVSDGITSIGDNAFFGCETMKKILIPDSVNQFGEMAFFNCFLLQEINMPKSLTEIGNACFGGCKQLKQITLPESVTQIGGSVFQGCSSLEEITIPEKAESIVFQTFASCTNLKTVKILNPNCTISDFGSIVFPKSTVICAEKNSQAYWYAMENDYLFSTLDDPQKLDLDISDDLKYTFVYNNKNDFYAQVSENKDKKIVSVTIPSTINYRTVKIAAGAFYSNSSLKNVTIADGLTEISTKAFYCCWNLEKIIIPQSVTSIGEKAFAQCDYLVIYGYEGSYAQTYANSNGIKFEAICPHTGSSLITKAAVAPTCTEKGYTSGTYCSVCKKWIKGHDAIAATGHTPTTAVKENVKKATCKANGSYDSVVYCSVCKAEISRKTVKTDKLAHAVVTDKAVEPTCTKDGLVITKCSLCGDIKDTEVIPATGHSDADKDGKCDACGEHLANASNCSCNCHKKGFAGFIYKIMRFFWKLFKIKKVCACGAAHY